MNEIIEYQILPKVSRPSRYMGNELNAVKKAWNKETLKVALIFPDLYELGHSGLAVPIIYHLINRQENMLAERCFAPWSDMEEKLRQYNLPLFSLESQKPMKDFDLLAFSIPYELTYTNILNILNLAHIPLKTEDRKEGFPLISAGGVCVANPEPLADFFDFFYLGEAEAGLIDVLEEIRQWKNSERDDKIEFLADLSRNQGIYVPALYQPEYQPDGLIKSFKPIHPKAPEKISKRVVKDLDSTFFPLAPIVPYMETVHERIPLELFRGCSRGCRFCQAGMLYRPLRERKLETLVNYAEQLLKNTGYEQMSLTSLSTTDYPDILPLIEKINRMTQDLYLEINLPSLRLDSFSLKISNWLKSRGRGAGRRDKNDKSGSLTFAIEAGSQELRNKINKSVTEQDLFDTVSEAQTAGWNKLKFYFMMGLPGETPADLDAAIELIQRLASGFRLSFNCAFSPFVPKTHTPFQWEAMESLENLESKYQFLKNKVREMGKKGRNIRIDGHNPRMSILEGIFARGDRNLSQVLVSAFEAGCRFDAWTEQFNFTKWLKAFGDNQIDPNFYLRVRDEKEILPWSHLQGEVSPQFLLKERKKAAQGLLTSPCRSKECQGCGVCPGLDYPLDSIPSQAPVDQTNLPEVEPWVSPGSMNLIRFQFQKGWDLRFISHLDLIRTIERAVRRSGLPAAYSQGFHPRMKLSFGPPLAVGIAGAGEWGDLELTKKTDPQEFKDKLNQVLPPGFKILKAREIPLVSDSLFEVLGLSVFQVQVRASKEKVLVLKERIKQLNSQKEIPVTRKEKSVDIKPFIHKLAVVSSSQGQVRLEVGLRHTVKGGGRLEETLNLLFQQDLDFQVVFAERTSLSTRIGSRWLEPLPPERMSF